VSLAELVSSYGIDEEYFNCEAAGAGVDTFGY